MRISDWSSDVCSSDLDPPGGQADSRNPRSHGPADREWLRPQAGVRSAFPATPALPQAPAPAPGRADRRRPPRGRKAAEIQARLVRSEELSVGKDGVITGRSRGSQVL